MVADTGRIGSADPATRPPAQAPAGLGDTASAPCAFTPGPWEVRSYDTNFWIVSADGIKVVQTSWHDAIRDPYPLKPEARANAHLIAAAPEMFVALDALIDSFDDTPATRLGRAALAKARGEVSQ